MVHMKFTTSYLNMLPYQTPVCRHNVLVMDALADERAFVLVRRTKISINVIQQEALRIKVLFMTEISDCRDQGKCFRVARSPTQAHFDSDLSHTSVPGREEVFPSHCTVAPGAPREQAVVSAPANHWSATGTCPRPFPLTEAPRQLHADKRDRERWTARLHHDASPLCDHRSGGIQLPRSPRPESARSHTRSERTPTLLCLPAPTPPTPCAEPTSCLGCRPLLDTWARATVFNSHDSVCPTAPLRFLKNLFIYLGLAMLGLCCLLCGHCSHCRVRASPCGGPSCCCSRAPSSGSTDAAHWRSCSTAGGNLPDRASNPRLLHWRVDSCPLSCQGSSSLQFHPPPLF